ncbi:MAG: alpha/beta fold hydrolase, partial [Bacteroidota bacterium]
MKLHHIRQGKGEPLIVLHGLMGMLDNWKTPAKRLSERYEVFLVDQRNHGRSPHSATFSYAEMAEDLYELMDDLFLSEAHILGHSMGGKVAMKFAQHHPDMVRQLVVADIAPKAYPVHHHTILEALSAVPLGEIKARSEAEAILGQYIPEPGVRQFLLKNLYWVEKGVLAWRFNLDAIREH